MSIFLLSDTCCPNKDLKAKLVSEIKNHGGKIAYISSAPQDKEKFWFHNTEKEYRSFNPTINLEYFDLSEKFSNANLKKVLDFGTIHLSGGNTFEFLNMGRQRNFGNFLKTHLEKSCLIIGVSAGSIILTPNVNIASSENTIGLKDPTGLNFVDFEFNPHFHNTKEQLKKLIDYSLQTPNLIYSCSDENGIFIDGKKVEILNNVLKIQAGKIIKS